MGCSFDPIIARCTRFDDAMGQEMMLCLLTGTARHLTFYMPPTECSDIRKHRICFINPTFRSRVDAIRCEDTLLSMKNLCKLIVDEMAENVVIDVKKEDGKHEIIASSTNKKRLETGEAKILNSKGQEKDLANAEITTKTDSFFKLLAQSFEGQMSAIIRRDEALKIRQIQEADEKCQSEKMSLFYSYFSLRALFAALSKLTAAISFGSDDQDSRKKAQNRAIREEREQQRRIKEDERKCASRRDGIRRQEIKRDTLRYEINKGETKLAERRHEISLEA